MSDQHFRFRGISRAVKKESDTGVLADVYHARRWQLRGNGIPIRPGFILKAHCGGGPTIDKGKLDASIWLDLHNPYPLERINDAPDAARERKLMGALMGTRG